MKPSLQGRLPKKTGSHKIKYIINLTIKNSPNFNFDNVSLHKYHTNQVYKLPTLITNYNMKNIFAKLKSTSIFQERTGRDTKKNIRYFFIEIIVIHTYYKMIDDNSYQIERVKYP